MLKSTFSESVGYNGVADDTGVSLFV